MAEKNSLERLVTIESDVKYMKDTLHKMDGFLFGNGRKGLFARMRRIETVLIIAVIAILTYAIANGGLSLGDLIRAIG